MASAKDAAEREVRVAGEVNRMIQSEVGALYGRLEALRAQTRFPSFAPVNLPMVLVLGNHSSGKSTFINHMLGQRVQKTGRAPTDCTFTVLAGGAREERLDGAALVRHAQYGFGDVQRLFGRDFVSQVELKVVAGSQLLDEGGLVVVDSPGMIDPPGTSLDRTDEDRGYDFKRVVQWFADRADVILVMFDPDKPGTTFETLDVLTNSLQGMSSKVLLILNKVDDFQTVHDFARAYGALCWNLSKVIGRKDLPFIYTMYVPQDKREAPRSLSPAQEEDGQAAFNVPMMLEHEFDGIRGEVIREVERAPDRATDNILNLLKATALRLKMHMTLVDACKKEYLDLRTFWKRAQIAGIVAGVGFTAFYLIRTVGSRAPLEPLSTDDLKLSTPPTASSASSTSSDSTTVKTSGGGNAWEKNWSKQVARSHSLFRFSTFFKIVLSSCASNLALWKASVLNLEFKRESVLQWLPFTFQRVYGPFLCKSDRAHDEIMAQWNAVQPGLELALSSTPLEGFPTIDTQHKSLLDDVLNLHVPRLDRCVRDRTGDDHAYLRFKHHIKPASSKREAKQAATTVSKGSR
ncbi:EH domain-containing protein 1 [Phytophthora pseudosyringae]|uniref:EH domain-containing protein 1 n=1 Tax=Phytophthora pseudosyringae TaxID=221518 RepID=A0A8T1WJT0_9STRA|nr:EH domain-containing protein 1 [Phytophthora pseudosyringae]